MNNTRFATIVHILTLLAKAPEQWLSSDWMAASIQINPVIVRKELSELQDQGWVQSRKGKEGGYKLQVNSNEISFAAIYMIVKKSDVLGKKNQNPNPKCPIGKSFNQELEHLFVEIDATLLAVLENRTLASFAQKFI